MAENKDKAKVKSPKTAKAKPAKAKSAPAQHAAGEAPAKSTKKVFKTLPGHAKRARPQKTQFFSQANVEHKWHIVDLSNQVVGRAASAIAGLLRGKNKVTFTPHDDCGDYVVAINAEKVKFTGKKWDEKVYRYYTGFRGGLKETTADKLFAKSPETVLMIAVKGMLPKSPLGRHLLTKLKVYKGSEHPHAAQKPEAFQVR